MSEQATVAAAIDEMKAALAPLPESQQDRAVLLAGKLAIQAASASPNAAGNFWEIFLEIFRMLLPLIIKLLGGI